MLLNKAILQHFLICKSSWTCNLVWLCQFARGYPCMVEFDRLFLETSMAFSFPWIRTIRPLSWMVECSERNKNQEWCLICEPILPVSFFWRWCHLDTLSLFVPGCSAVFSHPPPVIQFLAFSHGPLNEPPPDGAVGAGRLDVELLDQPERLRHEQRHPKGQQGGHEGIQGRLLCLEGDLELGRSGTLAEAGSECILAEETWVTLWWGCRYHIVHSVVHVISLPKLIKIVRVLEGWKFFWCLISCWLKCWIDHTRQEFNKKFRASDEFKKSVSEDKIESFGKVLQKFFDNEREDYKKDVAMKTPDYDALQKKANQAGFGIIILGKKGSLSACFIKNGFW